MLLSLVALQDYYFTTRLKFSIYIYILFLEGRRRRDKRHITVKNENKQVSMSVPGTRGSFKNLLRNFQHTLYHEIAPWAGPAPHLM